MSLFSRLKRLWELSGTSDEVIGYARPVVIATEPVYEGQAVVFTPEKKLATVIPDDPLEIFPNETDDDTTS